MPPVTVPRSSWHRPTRRRGRAIRDRLREVYGVPCAEPRGAPVDELILTVLSQSTSDRNRDVAFLRLRERFPPGVPDGTPLRHGVARRASPQVDWDAVRDAPLQ